MAKTRILIAQAERSVAMEIRKRLEALGYNVAAVVSSGRQAIKKAEALRPDLVMTDTVLERGSDGIETARWIRSRLKIPIIYCLLYTSDAADE